ncbi:MAG TPA: SRPBCC family protein [Draconibacterium sp.]|nr:SRPBCC family protein [Draconibacterium sp.]
MAFYQFRREQYIKSNLSDLWKFISTPQNLQRITPPYMGFDIRTPDLPQSAYEGMIIAYTVRPLFGVPATWVTEITHVIPQKYFVDEQREGPYKLWHHEHHIEAVENGVLMKDIISYIPPMGILGHLANALIIRKKLNEIFDYRKKALDEIFREE